MKKAIALFVCALLVASVYVVMDGSKATATAAAKTAKYVGTIYVAGMGGHFATVPVEIDPSNTENPIKLTGDLDRMTIGTKDTHPTHDPRIDSNDKTKMFWSTYKLDKAQTGRAIHVGMTDLKTGNVVKDIVVQADDRAKWTGAMYCASAQTKNFYIPITMTGEAYIDLYKKADLSHSKRVFLDGLGYKDNYWFFHGINSPDMKTMEVVINATEKWADANTPGKPAGKFDILLLDMASLEKGEAKVINKATFTGEPGKTLTFRSTFTPDGKYILQSGGDRFYLIDAKTLKTVDEEMMNIGENHDAMPTPDGKYAILTARVKVKSMKDPEAKDQVTDGQLLLYDIENKKIVGKAVSACYACHAKLEIHGNAALCGLDGNLEVK